MDKYEKLQKFIEEQLEKAEDKEAVDALSDIKNDFNSMMKEQSDLKSKNDELLTAYKALIHHTAYEPTVNAPVEDKPQAPVSAEEALMNYFTEKYKR